MPIDISKEITALRKIYSEAPSRTQLTALILGEAGSGKTFLMRTAPKPVHIDQFDHTGAFGLSQWVDKGEIIVDNQYDSDDPMNPKAFALWSSNFERRRTSGYFENFGSYCMDSATSWSNAIMNYLLAKDGIPGSPPRWAQDYVPQKTLIHNYIQKMLTLPCHVFMLGHLEPSKDEVTKTIKLRFATTGKGVVTIPSLFGELWVMDPVDRAGTTEYRILLQSTGTNLARSRLASDGKLAQVEPPNIKYLLKKAGFPYADKAALVMSEEVENK